MKWEVLVQEARNMGPVILMTLSCFQILLHSWYISIMGIPLYLKGNEFLKNYQKRGVKFPIKMWGLRKGRFIKKQGEPCFFNVLSTKLIYYTLTICYTWTDRKSNLIFSFLSWLLFPFKVGFRRVLVAGGQPFWLFFTL